MLAVHSAVYNVDFDDLGADWLVRWGTIRELPEGGIELTRDHVQLYEYPEDADEGARDSESTGRSDRSSEDELPLETNGSSDDDSDADLRPRNEIAAPRYHGFVDGPGEIPEHPPFEQALRGHGWLPGAVQQSAGDLVLTMVRQMIAWVVTCTNRKIQQEHLPIPPVTFGELLKWHAIRILQCIIKLPRVGMYWSTPSTLSHMFPNFADVMPFSRFKAIRQALRFEDYAAVGGDDHNNRAWKIRTISTLMQDSFRRMMRAPAQHIAVDEGMVRYTGRRCPIRRRLPNKPIPVGMKFFAAVDVATGFMFDFWWDDATLTAENCQLFPWGMTGEVVLRFIRPLPGRGYIIYTDNYYTSIPLAQELRRRGHHLIGTMRRSRGVPECVLLPSKRPTRNTPRGTVRYAHDPDTSIHIYGWMDSGAVYLLDTFHGPQVERLTRRVGAAIQEFELPVACNRYNQNMNGVDRYDQIRTGYYGIEMSGRTAKWTVRAYEALFNMAIANAYALHKHLHGGLESEEDHCNFMLQVAREFLDNKYDEPVQPRGVRRAHTAGNIPHQGDGDLDTVRHSLAQFPTGTRGPTRRRRLDCAACPRRVNGMRDYTRRTSYYCNSCGVGLHPECFEQYHANLTTHTPKRRRQLIENTAADNA